MKIEIVNSSGKRIPREFLQELDQIVRPKILLKLASVRMKKLLKKDLVLVFVDKIYAKKLNTSFRKRNYATDVLSFSPIEDASLGELVFCYDVVRAQAKEHGLSFKSELSYLYIHGVLHLLGFDHEKNKAEARKMFAIQDQIFASLR